MRLTSLSAFGIRVVALAIVLLPFCATLTQAQTPLRFVVIVNSGNPVSALPRSDVSKLFLGKLTRWATGQRAIAVDQVESSPVRRLFSTIVHRMDVPSVKGYWQELVFSGSGDPPPERASDAAVMAFVKTNPNSVGYVNAASPIEGVKIVTMLP